MGLFDRFTKKDKQTKEETLEGQELVGDWFWESFLMNESKFRHQQETVKRSSEKEPITLSYILKELLNIDLSDIGSMTIVSRGEFGLNDQTEIIAEPSRVLEYQPYKAILYKNDKGEILPKTGENTILVISYRPRGIVYDNRECKNDKSKLCSDNSIIMFLRGLDPFMHETAYMRVSVMIPNFSSPDDFRCGAHSDNNPFTTSFILAYDITTPEKRLKMFDKIETSLREKDFRHEQLTNDETLILESTNYPVSGMAKDFAYGRKLVKEQRYADALLSLQNAYERLKEDVVIITNYPRIQDIFNETCFNIGLCLNEMGQFDRAVYYLDIIQGSDNTKYIIEYINALINSGDPRSLNIVHHYLQEFNNGTKKIDSEESSVFYDFLCRRLAYLFIDYKMWDKARNLLEQLKESPSCHDFAVRELDYLKNLGV